MSSQSTSVSTSSLPSNGGADVPSPDEQRPYMDPSRLAPEDAFYAHSPPRRQWERGVDSVNGSMLSVSGAIVSEGVLRRRREKESRSRSRKRKGVWKKLLWVKQSYPDNYTDPPTFLSHLQRNPRWQPYDFWPLVADSMVIVQHVCSVAIFVCCFVGIYQKQVSPISVVSWGSAGTLLGWVFWDMWIGQEEKARSLAESSHHSNGDEAVAEDSASVGSGFSGSTSHNHGLGLSMSSSGQPSRSHSRNRSSVSLQGVSTTMSPTATGIAPPFANYSYYPPYNSPPPFLSVRNQQRLATAKSALLIYGALLGLSPILKSLTWSTTSDSIWAMSTWLMIINVFFFDYGGSVGAKFPASLSTNAALMASTVLASRLTDTTHVFSLTLFSIEVFGLFPVFRRHLRHRSWHLHVLLTALLVAGSGAGLGITLVGGGRWKAGIIGAVIWSLGNVLAMGGCSWWLIGLQRYKNVVIGPWDPARPIIRAGGWD